MTLSTGVGRGHGHHHTGPRAKKPTMGASPTTPATAMPPSATPVASKKVKKGVGKGHGKHHHGPEPKAHHPHKKKVK